MTASPPVIISSDKEDTRIREHKVALERAKEERQRQREEESQRAEEAERAHREVEAEKAWRDAEAEEAQKMAEVEEAQRRAEAAELAQKDAEKSKKAEALVARWKQLELLSQCKVAAHIAWEEEARRASEADEGVALS